MESFSLRRDGKRFGVEALCLLMVLYGEPLWALQAAAPPVRQASTEVENTTDGWRESLEAVGSVVTEGFEELDRFAAQPWTDALAILLASGAGEDPEGFLTDAVAGEGDQRFDAVPPLPPGFDQRRGPSRRAGLETVSSASSALLGSKNHLDAIPVLAGWNLLSIPEEPADPDPATVLAPIAGSFTQVLAYDACDPADPWKLYDPADPAASDLLDLDPTRGLWVDATGATSLPSDGTLAATTSWQLCAGWNLIGFPAGQPRHVRNALQSIEGKVSRVFGFDLADPIDPWEIWDATAPEWANDLSYLRPGFGYWVLVSEDVTLEIANQAAAPTVTLTTPTDLAEVTAPTEIRGTIASPILDRWTLSSRFVGGDSWVELATGEYPISDGVLATFDPTLLLNGLYEIRLEAVDLAGMAVEETIAVVVEGNMKIGLFSLLFVDLEIPVAGLDIEVVRTYDSRQRFLAGDFGQGWTLDVRQGSYRNNRPPGDGWQIFAGALPCQTALESKSHLTTVRLSDQEVYRFRLTLDSLAAQLGGCRALAGFAFVDGPEPGATLEVLGNNDVFWENGGDRLLDIDTLDLFQPRRVRLTTRDGRRFDLDLEAGVERLEDANGNTLTISPSGIQHDSGVGIDFERDAAGRITRITDPSSAAREYGYDADGNLVTYTEPSGSVTTYTYHPGHLLDAIQDPLGRTPVRTEYDADGRVIRTIDAHGRVVRLDHDLGTRTEVLTNRLGQTRTLEYDARGNTIREVDESGAVTLRTYDADDRLLSETDPLGRTTTFVYDAGGDRIRTIDALGRETRFEVDTAGRLVRQTDPRGNVVEKTFDPQGNLLTLVEAGGQTTAFTYDGQGNELTRTDPLGQVTTTTYDPRGYPLNQTDATGGVTTWAWDANGRLATESRLRTLADGSQEAVTRAIDYDADGRVLSMGYVDDPARMRFDYDAAGQRIGRTNFSGQTFATHYDAQGRLLGRTLPDGTSITHTYDEEGRVVRTVDREGHETFFTYDAVGRLLTTTLADGAIESRSYDAAGQLLSITDPLGRITRFEYDAAGQRIRQIDALGNVTETTYDANGNRASVRDALGRQTRFDYDPRNRLTEWTFADGTTLGLTYDAMGRRVASRDELGRVTGFDYDALGRVIGVTDTLGRTTSFSYDEVGNQTAVTDALDRTTRFEVPPAGPPSKRQLPDGSVEQLVTDSRNNLLTRTDFAGRTTTFDYDSLDRLVGKTYPDGSTVTLTYTASGQRASVIDARGTTTYAYDTRDRLTAVTDPAGRQLLFTYDLVGNRTSQTAVVGSERYETTYTYDALDRLHTVTDPEGQVYTFDYDAVGNRTRSAFPNGVETASVYDARDRLVERRTVRGVDVLASYDATLAADGRRLEVEEADGTRRAFDYDALGRLTRERVEDGAATLVREESFDYDAVGNRLASLLDTGAGPTTTTSTYDVRDRLTQQGTAALGWDANGNQSSRSGAAGSSLAWDFENRLVGATLADGRELRYTYDFDGNLVRREVTPVSGPALVVDYLVDPSETLSQVVLELDGSGSVVTHYTRGERLLAALRPATGEKRFYHLDGLGSVRTLTDATGTVTDRYAYTAFGQLEEHQGDDPNPYRFAGEPFDGALGLAYHRARWLDPSAGRFVSMDPFEGLDLDPSTLHRYLYADLDPINLADPTGESGWAILLVILGFIALWLIADHAWQQHQKKKQRQRRAAALARELNDYAQSRDAAAMEGMRAIYDRCIEQDIEWCGPVCLQSDGVTCQVGPPPAVSGGKKSCDPPDCSDSTTRNAGIYHCHGRGQPGDYSEYFSTEDTFTASVKKTTVYLVTPKGVMKKYRSAFGSVDIGKIGE